MFYPLGTFFRFLARQSETRRSREAVVVFDPSQNEIQLLAAQRHRRLNLLRLHPTKIVDNFERIYCVRVLSETIRNAIVHVGLAELPGDYFEFILRWGFRLHNQEQADQMEKTTISDLVAGNLHKIVEYEVRRRKKEMRKTKMEAVTLEMEEQIENYYEDFGDEERSENSENDVEDENGSQKKNRDVQKLNMLKEDTDEILGLFDDEALAGALPIADLYLAVYQLQLKSPETLRLQFAAFKTRQQARSIEEQVVLRTRLEKLQVLEKIMDAGESPDLDDVDLEEQMRKNKQLKMERLEVGLYTRDIPHFIDTLLHATHLMQFI